MKRFVLLLLPLLLFCAICTPVPPAEAFHATQTFVRIGATCGEALAVGQVVAIKDADGKAYKADANDATLRPAVGIVGLGCASGGSAEIVTYGKFSGWTNLSEGTYGYLSETAGLVTQSAPTYAQPLGFATSTTEYLVNFGNYFDTSSLTAVGVQSQDLAFEGATADAYETTLTITDPTADRAVTIPDAAGVVVLSAAVPTAATSFQGVANGIEFEGATADAYETTISVVDPTADRAVSIPNAAGTVDLLAAATHDYAGGAVAWTMTAAEGQATFVSVSNANGAVTATLPAATAGKIRTVYNNSGQVLTLKVTGQTGGTVATGKYAIYTDNGTDVVEIYEQP